jgi:hypothetical protein
MRRASADRTGGTHVITSIKFSGRVLLPLFVALFALPAIGQDAPDKNKDQDSAAKGTPIMWEQVDIAQQDLYNGPAGPLADLGEVTFVSDQKGGHSTKYRIKDSVGRIWIAKIGDEAQPETAAVRLLAALGYKTEINYLVPKLTIPGKGDFTNVRLEARPENVKRLDSWLWHKNPFRGTRELQGLKILMAFLNNWDMKSANNVILQTDDQLQYVVSDLGVSFGRTGNNGLPVFWRVGRSRNVPPEYAESDFVKGLEKGEIKFAFNGKNMGELNDITVADGRWLADLMMQLSDKQIEDAFRAANYSDADIKLLAQSVKRRIRALDLATRGSSIKRVETAN